MDELDVKVILGLAEHRMNTTRVANSIFIHRNSVLYHIERIKRITGLDPTNFYDLYELVQMVGGGKKKQANASWDIVS